MQPTLPFAEGKVTKLRREFKLLVSARDAESLTDALQSELDGAQVTPTQITSIYFDRAGLPLAARAIANPSDCLKVRTKEYFPDLGAPHAARAVFEVKREKNGLTRKRRLWVPRTELAAVLSRDLMPVLAVTYERCVYQRQQEWRVTFDRDVCFHPVTPAVALSPEPVHRGRLPPELDRERWVVVEVKHLGAALPGWLQALQRASSPCFSKFAEGMRRLHPRALEVGG